MTPWRPVIALLVAFALAGCVGAGTDAAGESPDPNACATEACDSGARDGNATSSVNSTSAGAAAPAPDPVVVPFAFDGRTAGGACPPSPPTRGASHCVAAADAQGEAPVLTGERPLSLRAELTAPDASGVQEFYASVLVDFGDGWEWDPAREPSERGIPPLTMEWDLTAYPAGTRFMFYVDAGASAGGAYVMLAEDYHADGSFTARAR